MCILVSSLVRPDLTAAATSNTINFQARLETNAGAIVPDGNYNVEFKLYSVATLGSAEWTEDYTYNSGPGSTDVRLRVANGYLTANLGSITAFPGTINWNQQQWLTMNIGGTVSSGTITWDGEMSPRLQLTAVPYAFAAGTLSTTDGSGNTGTLSFGTVTNNPVITLPNASGTVCLQSSSSCGFATGSGTAFLQGGNSFGAQGVLGTNDSNSLAIRTNNTNKLVIDTSGNLQLQQASTFNIASAAGGSQLTIQAGANSTAAGTGGTLLLQGGAPGTTGASGSVIVKANTNDSTTAFEVQSAGGANLFTVDTSNTAVVLGNDGTPTALTVRGGVATGSNAQGANMTFDASNGTGNASSGDVIFRTAASGANQATLDVTSSNTTSGASSLTWTHVTGSHSNQILIVGVGTTGAANDVTGITYNGVALTKVNSETCPAGNNCDEELWYLVSPASGSHSIVVSLGDSQAIFGGAATYYNVNTTTPFGTSAVSQGGSNPSSITITTTSSQLVVDGIMDWSNGGLGNPSAGQTKLWEPNLFGFNGGGSSKVGGSSSTTMGWAINYGNWADVAVPINPAASTTPATLTDRLHIAASGNVGIDNTNPQYALDVVGSGNFSTSVLSPTLDTATAVTLNVGTSLASGIVIGSTSSGTTTLQSNGGVKVSTLTAATSNSAAVCRDTSTKLLTACDASNTTGRPFLQGGNSFGAQGVLGTNDSNSLAIRTGGTNRLVIDASGNLQLQQASTVNVAASAAGSSLTIQGGAATVGWTNGGNLVLQGGSGVGGGVSGSVIVQPAGYDSTSTFQVQDGAGAAIFDVDTYYRRVEVGDTTLPDATLSVQSYGQNAVVDIYGNSAATDYGVIQVSSAGGVTNPRNRALILQPNGGPVGIGTAVPGNSFSVSPLDYQTGTVTRTHGSATLVGTGTTWTSSMVGDISVFADGTTNTVAAFTDATHITMGTTYAGTTDASPITYSFNHVGLQMTSGGTTYVAGGSTSQFQVQNATGSSVLTVDTVNSGVGINGATGANLAIQGDYGGYGASLTLAGTGAGGNSWIIQSSDGSNNQGQGMLLFSNQTTSSVVLILSAGGGNQGATVFGDSQSFGSNNGIVTVRSDSAYGAGLGGSINFTGSDGSVDDRTFGAIGGFKTNGTSGDQSGYLGFATRGSSGNTTQRLILDSNGNLQLQQAATLNVLSATTGSQLTIQAGAATSGTNVGGNLVLQGGAGASTGTTGSVIVKANTNNSTTAFQVQNAGGTALLTVDTTNLRVIVGAGATGEATPTLLVVDSETGSSTDPSGVNGAIYYNATNQALRCDNNGSWQNCTPGVAYSFSIAGGTTSTQSIASAGTIIIAPLYVSGQITVNTLRVEVTTTLGTAGDAGVYNAAGGLVLDGGSGSLSTAAGVKTITPTQANKTLEPGQYYVAVTWNSTTGTIRTNTFSTAGTINRAGVITTGGGLVLPASLTLSSIINVTYMPVFSMNN